MHSKTLSSHLQGKEVLAKMGSRTQVITWKRFDVLLRVKSFLVAQNISSERVIVWSQPIRLADVLLFLKTLTP